MARIKNMGTATMKLGEGTIISGSAGSDSYALVVTGSSTISESLIVSGDVEVAQKIIHAGDSDTLITFNDNQIILKAGNLALVTAEKNSSSPHEVTINDGGNNVDFVVKGNGSNQGNPGMKFDASTNRLGINGIGTPTAELDVDGDIKARGDLYTDKIRRSSDSDTTTKILLNDELLKFYAADSINNILAIGNTGGEGADNNFWVSGSIGPRGSSSVGTAIFGGDVVISGSLYTKQRHINTAKFSSTDNSQRYVRWDAAGSNGTPGVNNKFLAPAGGRLLYVTIRCTSAANGTNIAFHKASDGSANLNTTAIETIGVDIDSSNSAFQAQFTATSNFNAGDILGISMDPSSTPNDVNITCVWEFDFVD